MSGDRSRDRDEQLQLPNLLNDIEALTALLVGQIESAHWLDAYLLACGIDQILEDALHRDLLMLGRITRQLQHRVGGKAGRLAGATAASARVGVWAVCGRWLGASRVARRRREVAQLVSDLADAVTQSDRRQDAAASSELRERAEWLQVRLLQLRSGVRREPLRLPSGFLNLDQCPADVEALIARVQHRWPDRTRPLLTIGVRTSGSYLAPLAAACLRAAGRPQVRWMTVRPGQRWLPEEHRTLRWAAEVGALVLVLDDPPNTWGTLAKAAEELRSRGLEETSIALLVQAFPGLRPPPDSLRGHPVVWLPWEAWHVHHKVEPRATRSALDTLLAGEASVGRVTPHPHQPRRAARKHVGILYDVEVTPNLGPPEHRLIYAEGVGLGYFGAHAAAVAAPLEAFLPTVYGVHDGVLYREWLPDADRLGEDDAPAAAERIVEYVCARAQAHPVTEDVSLRASGRDTVWRWAGRFLSHPFGRAEVLLWPLVEAVARGLLRVDSPSVVDGRTGITNWFRDGRDGRNHRKVRFADGAFNGFDMYCYDPVFDLAGAAASCTSDGLDARLRQAYTARTGHAVDPERWLLYQLAHLSGYDPDLTDPELERKMSRSIQRYYAEAHLQDLTAPADGELCAIDIDGVLEDASLGVPATTPAGLRALRSLHRHGYRAVIASGRSLEEVRDRCIHYRLAGGVAEYGAVTYVADGDRVRELLTVEERSTLSEVRRALEHVPGVLLDRGYTRAVRAYRVTGDGQRRGLRNDEVAATLRAVGPERIRPIHGEGQTDFMARRVSKSTGVESLAADLDVRAGGTLLAMAIGDTASDLPMLRLAGLACAPGNAAHDLRQSIPTVSRYAYQAGVEDAVALLLGHRPGGCRVCAGPHPSPRAELLLPLLSRSRRDGRLAKAVWIAMSMFGLAVRLSVLRRSGALRSAGAASGGRTALMRPAGRSSG